MKNTLKMTEMQPIKVTVYKIGEEKYKPVASYLKTTSRKKVVVPRSKDQGNYATSVIEKFVKEVSGEVAELESMVVVLMEGIEGSRVAMFWGNYNKPNLDISSHAIGKNNATLFKKHMSREYKRDINSLTLLYCGKNPEKFMNAISKTGLYQVNLKN